MAAVIVDNGNKLRTLITHITDCLQREKDQLIFIDLEGVNLSRHGTVAIMQLLMPPERIVYLIDVHVLGVEAFQTTTDDGNSLKTILESKTIFKVFFDIRNDSDALHAHFEINIAGVIDLQIIEYATRQPRGRYVNGLARCIQRDLPLTQDWSIVKENGLRLFAPERGGTYQVFLQRPLPTEIIKYCEQDVMLMPRLLAWYSPKLRANVATQIQGIVDDRISLSKTATFNGKGMHMAIGPHLKAHRVSTTSPMSPEVEVIRSTRLQELCRLDDSPMEDLINSFEALSIPSTIPTVSNETVASMEHAPTAIVTHSDDALVEQSALPASSIVDRKQESKVENNICDSELSS